MDGVSHGFCCCGSYESSYGIVVFEVVFYQQGIGIMYVQWSVIYVVYLLHCRLRVTLIEMLLVVVVFLLFVRDVCF